jgi:hypothetical protein
MRHATSVTPVDAAWPVAAGAAWLPASTRQGIANGVVRESLV